MRYSIRIAICLALTLAPRAHAVEVDWRKVDAILGRAPTRSGDVYRYGLPRGDLSVTVDGVTIKPALALGGWVAFEDRAGESLVMGDLVLTEREVNPAISRLLAGGIDVSALHNHLLRASPPTFYLHISGRGEPTKLAETIRAALAVTGTPLQGASPLPAAPLDLDATALDEIIGAKGRANGGVYQFAAPRVDAVSHEGTTLGGAMGVANVVNFQPTGGGKAAITGDFLALANEVGPLIGVLRAKGVEVTAIHSHMLDEEPRTFYIHFWANDDALTLARALRAALDKVNAASKN